MTDSWYYIATAHYIMAQDFNRRERQRQRELKAQAELVEKKLELVRSLQELFKDPEWAAWRDCCALQLRLEEHSGFEDLPEPRFGEKPELYRQRLRKAIADRRARAACLDLRRRLMERGMDHVPIPRNSETPEEYRRRIRKVRNILADRRK